MLLLFAGSPSAFAFETIGWDNLAPKLDQSKSPYLKLAPELRRDFINLWTVYKRKAVGRSSKGLDSLEAKSIAALREAGADPSQLIHEMVEFVLLQEANESALVESMNGKSVRITGYLLPIEFSGEHIVEFLLVPSDGACVHTPVPPLNQLIHVRADSGITNPGLFSVVRVSGQISTGSTERSVVYSDGDTPVVAGYSMVASGIELYE